MHQCFGQTCKLKACADCIITFLPGEDVADVEQGARTGRADPGRTQPLGRLSARSVDHGGGAGPLADGGPLCRCGRRIAARRPAVGFAMGALADLGISGDAGVLSGGRLFQFGQLAGDHRQGSAGPSGRLSRLAGEPGAAPHHADLSGAAAVGRAGGDPDAGGPAARSDPHGDRSGADSGVVPRRLSAGHRFHPAGLSRMAAVRVAEFCGVHSGSDADRLADLHDEGALRQFHQLLMGVPRYPSTGVRMAGRQVRQPAVRPAVVRRVLGHPDRDHGLWLLSGVDGLCAGRLFQFAPPHARAVCAGDGAGRAGAGAGACRAADAGQSRCLDRDRADERDDHDDLSVAPHRLCAGDDGDMAGVRRRGAGFGSGQRRMVGISARVDRDLHRRALADDRGVRAA